MNLDDVIVKLSELIGAIAPPDFREKQEVKLDNVIVTLSPQSSSAPPLPLVALHEVNEVLVIVMLFEVTATYIAPP